MASPKKVTDISRRGFGAALVAGAAGLGQTVQAVAGEAAPPGTVSLPARNIPIPESISPQAQAILREHAKIPAAIYPRVSDKDAWRKRNVSMREQMLSRIGAGTFKGTSKTVQIGSAKVYVATPLITKTMGAAVLSIHGGGFVIGDGEACKIGGQRQAGNLQLTTYAVDYRIPPDHPYPAPLDDCMAAYKGMLELYKPEQIVITGGSAGGNLAAVTVLRARDEGLPMPAAVVLLTPEVDLTESGDTFEVLDSVNTVLAHRLSESIALYANGHDLKHPYLSPLFADFSKGYPPTLVQSGTRDLFLSNTVRMHRALRRAGILSELHVWEAMPHGGFGGTPEDEERDVEVRRFMYEHLRI